MSRPTPSSSSSNPPGKGGPKPPPGPQSTFREVELPEAKEGEEGWRQYSIDEMWNIINQVVTEYHSPEITAMRQQAIALAEQTLTERYENHPLFQYRPSMLKMLVRGLDSQQCLDLGEIMFTLYRMQQAKTSKEAKEIEFEFGVVFNRKKNSGLMNMIPQADLDKRRDEFMNCSKNKKKGKK
jgi:hypothetical protein